MSNGAGPPPSPQSGVQSLNRALDVLEVLAAAGGELSIVDIAAAADIPLATAHRLVRTLLDRGYVRQLADRRYALGSRLVPLGATANVLVGAGAQAVLTQLVTAVGETANLAVLSGTHAQYVAQVPSQFAMRMFTAVGRRVELHCTGVGKALLSQLDEELVAEIVTRVGLPRHTPHTICDRKRLASELMQIRADGFAVDEQEQELGVRCVAVPVDRGRSTYMAVSVSGPTGRLTRRAAEQAVPLLREASVVLAGSHA